MVLDYLSLNRREKNNGFKRAHEKVILGEQVDHACTGWRYLDIGMNLSE